MSSRPHSCPQRAVFTTQFDLTSSFNQEKSQSGIVLDWMNVENQIFFRRFFHSVQFPRREKTVNAYASLIVTHGEGTSFFVDLRSSPPARYIKQASNNRISSRVLRAKLLIKCNGVTQLPCP